MILDALNGRDGSPLTLLFGVRYLEDRLYHEELAALAVAHPNLRVEYTLSQPAEGWTARRGYVQTHVEELWADLVSKGAGSPHAYICGLERMVGAVRELLRKRMGVDRKLVHTERYD
jgi:NAD(P)H-flavin reductase